MVLDFFHLYLLVSKNIIMPKYIYCRSFSSLFCAWFVYCCWLLVRAHHMNILCWYNCYFVKLAFTLCCPIIYISTPPSFYLHLIVKLYIPLYQSIYILNTPTFYLHLIVKVYFPLDHYLHINTINVRSFDCETVYSFIPVFTV